MRLVVPWAFNVVGAERLEILTYPGNAASQALAGQWAFEREGVLRGFLAAEPGKGRAGRVQPNADGWLPARDDQVLSPAARRLARRLTRRQALRPRPRW